MIKRRVEVMSLWRVRLRLRASALLCSLYGIVTPRLGADLRPGACQRSLARSLLRLLADIILKGESGGSAGVVS
jgi:hypothetical protein